MLHDPSSEANWFAASQEIARISRNPKVHYRTHKRPPPVPILGQPNLIHIPTSHLLQIESNIIHPSKPRSPQWSLSLRVFLPRPYLSTPIRATCPAHLILLEYFILHYLIHKVSLIHVKHKTLNLCSYAIKGLTKSWTPKRLHLLQILLHVSALSVILKDIFLSGSIIHRHSYMWNSELVLDKQNYFFYVWIRKTN